MADSDIIVIGAGHNALVCAAYLAQAGHKVLVIERRHIVGGAVVTEEIIPGYRFDLGGSAHILINHTSIVSDLRLAEYGLDYIDLDPLFFAPFPDGSHITIWKDIDRTCQSIAAVCPEDADNYRAFVLKWRKLGEAMVEVFQNPPTVRSLFQHFVLRSGMTRNRALWMNELLRGYGQVVNTAFKSPQLRAVVAWMAAQSGPPPGELFSAPLALWHPMYHVSGMRRPRGGSGMLTQALAAMIQAHGGTVITDSPVSRILVERGRAVGVTTPHGHYTASKAVVSGAHLHTTLALLASSTPPHMAKLAAQTRIGNGIGMIIRCAMDELPNYTALPGVGPQHIALQFICPSVAYLERAYGDYLGGMPAREPALISMTFSAADPTLAPPGKHTLFLWGQYHPYALASGESWDDIGQREADKMLSILAQYAPNVPAALTGQLVQTPLYIERTLGLLRGNVMHLEMSVDQMLFMRPALSLANYRTPIKGLYLTGASTHPGGGIMGAAGRNAAHVMLRDLGRPS